MKYVHKPTCVDAIQWKGDNFEEVKKFAGEFVIYDEETHMLQTRLLEGDLSVEIGKYLIKGVDGQYYPCSEEVFSASYEPSTVPDGGEL